MKPAFSNTVQSGVGLPDLVRRFSTVVDYPAGARLYAQGEQMQNIFLLADGAVGLARAYPGGREAIVDILRTKEIFDVPTVRLGCPAATSAHALQRSEVCVAPAKAFLLMLESDDLLRRHVANCHDLRLYGHSVRISDLAVLTSRQRLEQFLWDLRSRSEGKYRIRFPFTEVRLAQYLGMTPQTFSSLLASLERDGVLERDHGSLDIDSRRLWHRDLL